MKHLLLIATLLCAGATVRAQAQQTTYFYQHVDASYCVTLQRFVLDVPCQEYVLFFVQTLDQTVTAYRIKMNYIGPDGTAGHLAALIDAAAFFPDGTEQTTVYMVANVPGITIQSTSVTPLRGDVAATPNAGYN